MDIKPLQIYSPREEPTMKKKFDAVRMVREIRNEHHNKTKGKSWEERIAFYKKEAAQLRKQIDKKK